MTAWPPTHTVKYSDDHGIVYQDSRPVGAWRPLKSNETEAGFAALMVKSEEGRRWLDRYFPGRLVKIVKEDSAT